MTDIPDNGIMGAWKNPVNRKRKLYYAQIACKVAAVMAYYSENFFSYFYSEVFKFIIGKELYILGAFYFT